jgi:hypothetical protein
MFNLGKGFMTLFKDRSVAVYNPQLLSLVIGSQPVNDFADEVVRISYAADNMNVIKGIDGKSALFRQTNKDAVIEFTLHQMSQTNKWLFDLQAKILDHTKPIELPQVTFTDYNLMVSWSSTSSFIQRHPDTAYNASAGTTTWALYCFNMQPRQNIKLDNSLLSAEQILFRKVGEAVKTVGKKVSAIFK